MFSYLQHCVIPHQFICEPHLFIVQPSKLGYHLNSRQMARAQNIQVRDYRKANVSLWTEPLFAAEFLLLHATPVYYGLGTAPGDGSAVVVIPGFLCSDHYLFPLHNWLWRIGYRPFFSGISLNAECPNLLIDRCIGETLDDALSQTGRKVHLIGHSLGGIIARSIASQRPKDVASVITLGAPFRGTVVHSGVLRAANTVRHRILKKNGGAVRPACYTGRCTCNFVDSLRRRMPSSVIETAVYTQDDGVVDWRYCKTDDPKSNFAVPGTHIGLAFNPVVYTIIADRLAHAHSVRKPRKRQQLN